MSEIKKFIDDIAKGKHLDIPDAGRMFQIIMAGGATPVQIASVLMGMKINGETTDEITGAVLAVRNKMRKLDVPDDIHEKMIDTCGTGGDGKRTYNISTAVAFVAAASGLNVAKHGNKAVSSRSGSADVLRALGVNTEASDAVLVECLREAGMCFMLASRFHPTMRNVAPVRQDMAIRTLFNVIGPLVNPAIPNMQIIGVYDVRLLEPVAMVLKEVGIKHVWVVHGSDGMDEITINGETIVVELKEGEIRKFKINPVNYGIEPPEDEDELRGGGEIKNAQALKELLNGKEGAYRDIVILNTAAALVVGGRALNMAEGINLAADSIDSGRARKVLEKLVEVSNREVVPNE